jgi:hypothetical protein
MDEKDYIKSLTVREVKSLNIAISHLGSSFELRKSTGFIKWNQARTQSVNTPPTPPTLFKSPI